MNGKVIIDIISWTIIAALLVLVVMNAQNVATVVTSIGGFWTTETSMFTGAGYGKATGKAYG
jgi:hypothetical protein